MENKFEEWAILELMGHRRLAGKVSESTVLGGTLLRIDIPEKEGKTTTQFYSTSAIYCLTPTTESIARMAAAQWDPGPIQLWEFPQLQYTKSHHENEGDE